MPLYILSYIYKYLELHVVKSENVESGIMNLFEYERYAIAQKQALEDKKKADNLKRRLEPFNNIESLEKAKELAKEILPTAEEYTQFYAGNAKCSVLNAQDVFRITFDTADEFICYDFS